MTGTVWLASYPKSGNTWFRMLVASLSVKDGDTIDINRLDGCRGIASAREIFDHLLLLDSGLLTHEEIDRLRPRLYEELRHGRSMEMEEENPSPYKTHLVKVHDAYTCTADGEPILAGARGADGAIVIVRDPRDVVASLANHSRKSLDEAVDFMNDECADFCGKRTAQPNQLRQRLLDWSGHVASWLDQRDIPVHLVRYEDLKRDAVRVFLDAMHFAQRLITREEAVRAVEMASFANLQEQERNKGFREGPNQKGDRPFFRRGQAGGWRSELRLDQVERIETKHAAMMRRLGYELSTDAAVRGRHHGRNEDGKHTQERRLAYGESR